MCKLGINGTFQFYQDDSKHEANAVRMWFRWTKETLGETEQCSQHLWDSRIPRGPKLTMGVFLENIKNNIAKRLWCRLGAFAPVATSKNKTEKYR